ncbi:MAG: tetratricopeptide repeat protein [Spartobacteria bacterium]|nr:tetratricopeptide repeat protein [Spartobacteria bacterium]
MRPSIKHHLPGRLALLVFILTFLQFSPSLRYELLNLDDPLYVTHNTMVTGGLTLRSVHAAFATPHAAMYAPLLWISYMCDVSFLGATPDSPRGFHLANVLFHSINAVLLFGLLQTLSKKPWRAFLFSVVWALHPLRVESVAWVAERKDVLAGFFFLLCVWGYVLGHPQEMGRASPWHRRAFHLLSVLSLAAGLLVKPMLVPVPFLLLALDFWPLRRMEFHLRSIGHDAPRLILEKALYFILAAAGAWLAFNVHRGTGSLETWPLFRRVESIPVHYAFYLFKVFRPRNLLPLYPNLSFSGPDVRLGLVLVLLPSIYAWLSRRRHPNILVGWLWFLGMFLPTIGLIRFGIQSVADRFTYLPTMGFSVALLFVLSSFPRNRFRLAWSACRTGCAMAIVAVLAMMTTQTLSHWKNSDSFYARILQVFPEHPMALYYMAGQEITRHDRFDTAEQLLDRALLSGIKQTGLFQLKALCLYRREGAAAAKEYLLRNSPEQTTFGIWEWNVAVYSHLLKQYDDALAYAEQCRQQTPPHDAGQNNVHLLAMTLAYETGDLPGALFHARQYPPYRELATVTLNELLPYYAILWQSGFRAVALDYFHRLIQTDPRSEESIRLLIGTSPFPQGEPVMLDQSR